MVDDRKAEAITQWQLGDWHTLTLQSDDEWLRLGACLVTNSMTQKDWHVFEEANPEEQAQLLTSVAYNGLGRSALLLGQPSKAQEHFEKSLAIGPHSDAAKMLAPLRMLQQASDLDVKLDPNTLLLHQSKPSKPRVDRSAQIQTLYGFLDQLLTQLAIKGKSFRLDGMKVFNGKDPFMAGKTVLALAYWVSEYPNQDRITLERIQQARKIIHHLVGIKSESWGAFFYLQGLQMLNKVNLLMDCFSVAQLEGLKEQLHWIDFIDKNTLALKNKPTNFYQVGFAIAQLRFQLGWDTVDASYQLLDKMQRHVEEISGEFGFADETNGKGRYDRYSFLLIAEIAHRMREAGLPFPEKMKKWLRNSVDYVLINLNTEGDGFQYGRSIGAYGDTAFLEILSAAAWYGLLNQEELSLSYKFCCLSTNKLIDFWWDKRRGTVNLWEDGRETDSYRSKHRILGENFSLIHQHIYTQLIFQNLGFISSSYTDSEYTLSLDKLEKGKLTIFNSDSEGGRQAVFTWRNSGRVFNFPLVNGEKYNATGLYSPFLYTSYNHAKLNKVLDLIPIIELNSGKSLIGLGNYKKISLNLIDGKYELSWYQDILVDINEENYSYDGIKFLSKIVFERNGILRKDYYVNGCEHIKSVRYTLYSFPNKQIEKNSQDCFFLNDDVFREIEYSGFEVKSDSKGVYLESLPNCFELEWKLII